MASPAGFRNRAPASPMIATPAPARPAVRTEAGRLRTSGGSVGTCWAASGAAHPRGPRQTPQDHRSEEPVRRPVTAGAAHPTAAPAPTWSLSCTSTLAAFGPLLHQEVMARAGAQRAARVVDPRLGHVRGERVGLGEPVLRVAVDGPEVPRGIVQQAGLVGEAHDALGVVGHLPLGHQGGEGHSRSPTRRWPPPAGSSAAACGSGRSPAVGVVAKWSASQRTKSQLAPRSSSVPKEDRG